MTVSALSAPASVIRDSIQIVSQGGGNSINTGATKPRDRVKDGPFINRYPTVCEQAAVIVFLAWREASQMAGDLVTADGGWTMY